MNETTFENAIVGDRVWSMECGWGRIYEISDDYLRPIRVKFCGVFESYYYSGCSESNKKQTLFWDEIKFEVPTRPKRKVKKVVEGWVNMSPCITESPCREPLHINAVYRSEQDAFFNRLSNCIYLGEPLFIRHEYEEVEE